MPPPKRKGKSRTGGKPRKAKVAEEQQVEAAEVEEAQEEKKGEGLDAHSEGKISPAEEKKAEEDPLAASSNISQEVEKPEEAAADDKPAAKSRGRKKKGESAAPLVPGTKRVTRSNPGPKEEAAAEKKAPAPSKAHIIIEHCKQCSSMFKTRASNIQSLLLEADPHLKITINPEKPRRGCFEVRDDGGRIFVSLKDLERPYEDLKNLDVEVTAQAILKQLA